MGVFNSRRTSIVSLPPGVSSADFFREDVPPASVSKPPRGSISAAITRKLSVTGSIRSVSSQNQGGWRSKLRTLKVKVSSHGTQRVPGIPEESEQAHLPSAQTPARLRSRWSTRLSLRRPIPAPTPAPSNNTSTQRTRPPAPPPYFYPKPITTDYWEEFSDENSGLNDRLYAQLHRVLAEQRYKEKRRTDRRRLQDLRAAAGLESISPSSSPISSESVSVTSLEIRQWLLPVVSTSAMDSHIDTLDASVNGTQEPPIKRCTASWAGHASSPLQSATSRKASDTVEVRRSVDLSTWSWHKPEMTLKEYALKIQMSPLDNNRSSFAVSSGPPSVSSLFEWDDSDVEDDTSDYTPPAEPIELALGGEFWMRLLNEQVDNGLRLSGMQMSLPKLGSCSEFYASRLEVESRAESEPSETSDVFVDVKNVAWPMPPRRQKSDDGTYGLAKKSLGSTVKHQRSYSMVPASIAASDFILTPPDSAKTIQAPVMANYSPPLSPPLSPTPSRTVYAV